MKRETPKVETLSTAARYERVAVTWRLRATQREGGTAAAQAMNSAAAEVTGGDAGLNGVDYRSAAASGNSETSHDTISGTHTLGYVTPDDEHQGRAERIRQARQDGLNRARLTRIAYHRNNKPNQP